MIMFTMGFCLTSAGKQVVLVHKKAGDPSGAGLNGPGGRIEPNETPLMCMEREWAEETGLGPVPWKDMATVHARDMSYCIHLYLAEVESLPEAIGTGDMEWEAVGIGRDWREIPLCSWTRTMLSMCLEGSEPSSDIMKSTCPSLLLPGPR
jgi:8-oxo-dGTP pyrophosphatase MutT (NUDIX family)